MAPDRLSANALKDMHRRLRGMRRDVDKLAATAETELLARIGDLDGIGRPDQCDWAERAWPWRMRLPDLVQMVVASRLTLGEGFFLFHDATHAEALLRQDPARHDRTEAAFGLILEIYRFDGSFVSLVQDLPPAALSGLTRGHFFSLRLTAEMERPITTYARLNIQHGPNCEQIVREVTFSGDHGLAEFDLAFSRNWESRITKAWIDLILDSPRMNRVAIWDMVMLRAPRADV